jgi:hypothetical protein
VRICGIRADILVIPNPLNSTQHCHVMPRPIGVGTISVHQQRRESTLHDSLVCSVEARFGAYVFDVSIAQIATRGGEQPLDLLAIRRMLFNLADLQ